MNNKLIIFDLDGVLVDSKEIHFNALNLALSNINDKYVISEEDQALTYEGLTTRSKLDILTHTRGLPKELHDYVWNLKQEYSSKMFATLDQDDELMELFMDIMHQDILIAVASNSIRATLDSCIKSLGLDLLVDLTLSNEDVKNPKPNPEIYNMCMLSLGATPSSTIIFEDSDIGRLAARGSGASLAEVGSRKDLTIDFVSDKIASYFG